MKLKDFFNAADEHQVWTNKFVGNTIKYDENKEAVWEFKRRNNLTKKEVKAGLKKDIETPMGTIRFYEPDEYKVITAELNFDVELDVSEYKEIIDGVLTEITNWDSVTMVRFNADSLNQNQEEALWNLEFNGDPLDRRFLIRQFETSEQTMQFMTLGMTLGIAVGVSTDHMAEGLSYGMLIGIVIGNLFDAKSNAKRKELWNKRIKSVTSAK